MSQKNNNTLTVMVLDSAEPEGFYLDETTFKNEQQLKNICEQNHLEYWFDKTHNCFIIDSGE